MREQELHNAETNVLPANFILRGYVMIRSHKKPGKRPRPSGKSHLHNWIQVQCGLCCERLFPVPLTNSACATNDIIPHWKREWTIIQWIKWASSSIRFHFWLPWWYHSCPEKGRRIRGAYKLVMIWLWRLANPGTIVLHREDVVLEAFVHISEDRNNKRKFLGFFLHIWNSTSIGGFIHGALY